MEAIKKFKTELELEEKSIEILKMLNNYSLSEAKFILKKLQTLIYENSKIIKDF